MNSNSAATAASTTTSRGRLTPQKLREYEDYIEDKMKKELQKVLEERDQLYEKIAKYLELRNNIQVIKEYQSGKHVMSTQVNLGQNFFVQAKVSNFEYIFVDVGLGFHAQLTLDEALAFIDKKEKSLLQHADILTRRANFLKSNIKFMLDVLGDYLSLPYKTYF